MRNHRIRGSVVRTASATARARQCPQPRVIRAAATATMGRDRLNLLYVSQFPPSPPTFGAQRRMQGLMAALAARHDITAVSLITPDLDAGAAQRAMREYCREVVLVPARAWHGAHKRLLQLRSLFSSRSYERHFFDVPGLRR